MRWIFAAAVVSAIVFHATGARAEADEEAGAVTGLIRDKTSGDGLAGVSVTAVSDRATVSATTGKDGRYALRGLAPGRYKLLIVYGKSRLERTVDITEGATTTVNARIDSLKSAEAVKVRDKAPESKAAPPAPKGKYGAVPPPYSDEAIDSDVWARAWLLLDVDVTGAVTKVTFLKKAGHDLDEIAEKEALKYKFRPATDDAGNPRAAQIVVLMEWPSYWYVRTLVSTGQPPCAGSGPLNLGSMHPVYRDCSTVDIPEGATFMEPALPPVQFLPF